MTMTIHTQFDQPDSAIETVMTGSENDMDMSAETPTTAESSATEEKNAQTRKSALLRSFNQAITAVTVCHGDSMSCVDPSAAVDFADRNAQKVMSLLAQQMTVSKAIVNDAQVLSMLVERIFA